LGGFSLQAQSNGWGEPGNFKDAGAICMTNLTPYGRKWRFDFKNLDACQGKSQNIWQGGQRDVSP